VSRMAIVLRQFRRNSPACSVEELQARIGALAASRQQLRADNAPDEVLEENRLELARTQWELSHALIQRYLPAA
jgi:two-component sensor histidine kinase